MSSSPTETFVDVTMPQMGVSVAEGTVVEWKKQPGDWVERDEIIASISTDKIDTDVEAPASGRVQEILVEVGTTVDVGVVMARIATDAKPGEPHASESESASEGTSEAEVALEAPGEAGDLSGDTTEEHAGTAQRGTPEVRRSGPRRYSPVVMRIAAEHGIDLEQVEGTGRGGRVRKPDVLAYLEGGNGVQEEPPMHIESPYKPEPVVKKAPAAGGQPLSRMRQSIGKAMIDSLRTAATCTTIIEADMTRIARDREKTGLTWLPYVARATIETLREFPSLNATLEGEMFTQYDAVNLGIAVSLGDGRADRAGDPRRAEPQRRGAGQGDQGAGPQGARQPADARRRPRRHVHDHQPRRLRLDHGHAGDQPAAGGDPRHRGGRQAAGGDHRRATATTRSRSAT